MIQDPTISAGTCMRCDELVLIARRIDAERMEAWSASDRGGFRVIGRVAHAVSVGEFGTHTPHRRVCGKS